MQTAQNNQHLQIQQLSLSHPILSWWACYKPRTPHLHQF